MSLETVIVIAVGLTSFCMPFMSSSLNVALPIMAEEFATAPELLTVVVSAYTISATATLLPASALANRIGYRRAYAVGALSSALAGVLVGSAPGFYALVAFRALQGMTNAIIFSSGMALLSLYVDKSRRGSAIGIVTACVYAGLTFSPSLGGFITEFLGWRCMFFLAAAGSLLAYVLTLKVPVDPPNTGYYAYLKMVLVFVSVWLALAGLSFLPEYDPAPVALALGLAGIGVYLALEMRSRHPLLPVSLLKTNSVLSAALATGLCNFLATFTVILLLSMYLQIIRGLGAGATGLFLMISPLTQCLVSLISGKLTARVSPHLLMFSGASLSTVGTVVLSTLDAGTPFYVMILAQIGIGIGFGLFGAPNTVVVMGSVHARDYALASALQAMARNLGMALGMVMLTMILIHAIDVPPEDPGYAGELNYALGVSFALSAACGIFTILLALWGWRAAAANPGPGDGSGSSCS